MDKEAFNKISIVHGTEVDSAKATKRINELLQPTLKGVDVNNPVSAATLKEKLLGGGTDIDALIAPGNSTVKFDGESATGETFGMAFVGALIKVVNAKALAQFLAEPAPKKEKARSDGLGSPAGISGRKSAFAGKNY